MGNDGVPRSKIIAQTRNSYGGVTYDVMSKLFNVEYKEFAHSSTINGNVKELSQVTTIEAQPQQIDDSVLKHFFLTSWTLPVK